MTDPTLLVALGSAGTLAIGVTAAATLKAWQGWLDVLRLELDGGRRPRATTHAGARIELTDLRERVRRLEAIANGGEL